jgi:hypothetical protein
MEILSNVVNFITANGPEIVSGIVAVLSGIIAISLVIPGEQPEKFLKGVVDFLSKFSVKK